MSTNVIAATPRKEKNKLGSLVKAFRKYYVPFVISIVLLIASVVFTILTPGMIRNLTNEISPFGKELVEGRFYVNFEAVTRYGIILVVYIAISFTTGFASGFILNMIIQKFSKDLRRGICEKINKMPLDYFDTTQTGDILSVMTNDVDTLSTSLQNSVSMLVQSAVMLIGVLSHVHRLLANGPRRHLLAADHAHHHPSHLQEVVASLRRDPKRPRRSQRGR